MNFTRKKKIKRVILPVILLVGALWLGAFPYQSHAADVTIDATNFPDNNFRITVEAFDTDGDGVLSQGELDAVTNISVTNENITSLKGIEYFTALKYLDCYGNQLTSLDLSHNSQLEYLDCYGNQLTSLDLSHNSQLEYLDCYENQLTSLNVSNNPRLEYLDCETNQLTVLDVSNNPLLNELYCYKNQLTELNVSNNPQLEYLDCEINQLTTLDVSNSPGLAYLDCYENQLTEIDLSHNINLYDFYCEYNRLTHIDCSGLTLLDTADFSNQQTDLVLAMDEGSHYVIDLVKAFPEIDVTKVKSIDNQPGYTYDMVTHKIKIDKSVGTNGTQIYYYDPQWLASPDEEMDVQFDWALGYTVDFESNGGTPVDSQDVIAKGKATKPGDPTKDGYEFMGWYADQGLTTDFDFNSEITKNITLYAKWKAVEKQEAGTVKTHSEKDGPNTGDAGFSGFVFWTLIGSILALVVLMNKSRRFDKR